MSSNEAYFHIPRNLPHAATIALRLKSRLLESDWVADPNSSTLMKEAALLEGLLGQFRGGNDPSDQIGDEIATEAAEIGRRMVREIERLGIGEDRLGQLIRNLFECLGLGKEGAEISLRAGENPDSLMRP
jgi:hypothetical protein